MKTVKISFLEVGKWLSVLGIVLFLAILLSSNKESQTEFGAMEQTVSAVADLTTMQPADNQMLRRLYGLDEADYEGVMLYCPTTNMGAEELLLIKLTNIEQQDIVKNAIDARITAQKNSFEGYGVDQFEMLTNCVTEIQGNYVLLVVADDPSAVRRAFLGAL